MTYHYELRLRHKSGEETVYISTNLKGEALLKKLHECMFAILKGKEPNKAMSNAVAERVKTEMNATTMKPDGQLTAYLLFKCSTGDIIGR